MYLDINVSKLRQITDEIEALQKKLAKVPENVKFDDTKPQPHNEARKNGYNSFHEWRLAVDPDYRLREQIGNTIHSKMNELCNVAHCD